MKDNKQEIDILTDTLTVLLVALVRMNRGELTQMEVEEILNSAVTILYPLTSRRQKEIARLIN
jgi:hypothetical protein